MLMNRAYEIELTPTAGLPAWISSVEILGHRGISAFVHSA